MTPPRKLVQQVRRLLARMPELATPDGACGVCEWASKKAVADLRQGEVIHLLGSRVPYPRRHADWRDYPARDPYFYHVVFRVGPWYIDLTARQLDPKAPHPLFKTQAQMRRDWIQMSPRELI